MGDAADKIELVFWNKASASMEKKRKNPILGQASREAVWHISPKMGETLMLGIKPSHLKW